jgi:hypothetical protein
MLFTAARFIPSLMGGVATRVAVRRNLKPPTRVHMTRPYRRRTVSSVSRAYSRDPLERIESIGGMNSDQTRWRLSQAAAIVLIERGTDEFFFHAGGEIVRLVVLTHGGEKYLQSEREKTHPDDLLDLAVREIGKSR